MKYKIQDTVTGKTVSIEGDMPPTEQEMEGIFSQAGLRSTSPKDIAMESMERNAPALSRTPADLPVGGFAAGLAQTVMPNVIDYAKSNIQKIGAGNLTPTKPSIKETVISAGGPLAETAFGTPEQKQKQAASREIAATVEGVKGLGKMGQGAVDYLGGVGRAKSLNPLKVSNAVEAEKRLASQAKVSGDDVLKAIEKETYPIGTGEKIKDLISEAKQRFAGRTMTLDEAMKEMESASVAFGKLGDVGKTAGAKLNSVIYGTIRKMLPDIAPEVAKEVSKQATLRNLPRQIKGALIPLSIAGGAAYGANTIVKALQGRLGQGQ